MKVYKFGGGSIKEAYDIKKLAELIKKEKNPIFIVVSALKKTTNALEELAKLYLNKESYELQLQKVYGFHFSIALDLFPKTHSLFDQLDRLFESLKLFLTTNELLENNFLYDQIVSFGELFSTKIISEYLNFVGIENIWLDARKYIKTDSNYREAQVNWKQTESLISVLDQNKTYLSQGFIGSDENHLTTTLGRESSDYSASIFAFCLKAESQTLWKDVLGVLNADPKEFPFLEPKLIPYLSYSQAFELAYHGASLIHPKTLKPLKEKKIKLYIRSFIESHKKGTTISEKKHLNYKLDCCFLKKNQKLISFYVKKNIFFDKNNNNEIFNLISAFLIKVNLIEGSYMNLNVVLEDRLEKINEIVKMYKSIYEVKILENVSLYTLLYHDKKSIAEIQNIIGEKKKILIFKSSFNKAQWAVEN